MIVLRTVLRVESLAELKSLVGWQLEALALVPSNGAFIYDPTSRAQDVGGKIAVKPDSIAHDEPGRWIDAATIGLSGSPGADGDPGLPGADGADGADGPTGPPGAGATFTAENKDVTTIFKGQPVTIHSSGVGVVLADADVASRPCDGIAGEDIAVAMSGTIVTEGTLTQPDWTLVTGEATLAPKATYFLSRVEGTLLPAPDSGATILQSCGRELTPDTLEVSIKAKILL